MPDPDHPDEAPPPAPPPGDFPPMPPAPAPDRAERQRCLSAVGEVLFGQPGPASLHDAFERIRALIEGDGGRAK
jgi:hypothetical protein